MKFDIDFENIRLLESYKAAFDAKKLHLDSSWKRFFSELEGKDEVLEKAAPSEDKALILRICDFFRTVGFLYVPVNPLNEPPQFDLQSFLHDFELKKEDLSALYPTCGILEKEKAPLSEIIETLRQVYSNRIGVEFYNSTPRHVRDLIVTRMEELHGSLGLDVKQKKECYKKLAESKIFETFLHTKFVGQKRFSLEGAESLIPLLFSLMKNFSLQGGDELIIGMSHRGRLNVLANLFQKSLVDIISEFHDLDALTIEGSGDVKYHKGFQSEVEIQPGKNVSLFMVSNPSHLESVDPVLAGYVHGRMTLTSNAILPILIHGDAAISGQGVVYETLELSKLRGYTIGGLIHVVINNHIGFTTLPKDMRSTPSCTDIFKSFGIPIFHVNAEDIEAVVWAASLAYELKVKFQTDVAIDLNCFRKYGHNESDEPAFTQPILYGQIAKKRDVLELFKENLIKENVADQAFFQKTEEEVRNKLDHALEIVKKKKDEPLRVETAELPIEQKKQIDGQQEVQKLIEFAIMLNSIPPGFSLHPRLKKNIEHRKELLEKEKGDFRCDWSFAEALAFASLISEAHPIRLVGQDSRRGTFSQRHAVWIDSQDEKEYAPLTSIRKGVRFEVYDSPLSEYAALGFEYGLSLADPETLVLWEAQFGDFANGAQIIIDQYIAAGETKWGAKSKLTLLLPHGYEGQGPEHSSARMERFLQLAAEDNLIVVAPTTPSQYFHLLRRQAQSFQSRKPLIVFTPKGLLRDPDCMSSITSIAMASFESIIDDTKPKERVEKLLFCQGRVYYDLVRANKNDAIAIIRIEELYPFNTKKFVEIIRCYPHIKDYAWVQEEPKNQGAWQYVRDKIEESLPKGCRLQYAGRQESPSPAVGSHELHQREHKAIMEAALKL